MKKILLLGSFALSTMFFAQDFNNVNKWSIDFGYGVNKMLSGPMMGKAVRKQFAHIELGARYMFNNKWGLYGGGVFENYKTAIAKDDFTTNSVAIKLEGVLNFRNSLDFGTFVDKFGAYGHSGPSLVLNMGSDSKSKAYKLDKLAGWTTGLALQYKVTPHFSIKGDVSFVAYLQGDRTIDLQYHKYTGLVNGFDGTSGNMTIGFSYYIGSAPEHADWTPTAYGDPVALAEAKAKMEKVEKDMLDDDNDGVPNYLDQEPATEAGANVDSHGKTIIVEKIVDTDGDGVLDVDDFCYTIKGVASANGCPDADGDGVYDFLDKCPNEKGNANNGGCPVYEIVPNSGKTKILNAGDATSAGIRLVQFDLNQAIIKSGGVSTLDQVVKVLKKNPNYNIEVNGHAGPIGSEEYNMDLSNRRADAVKEYLISKGISEGRISTKGYGETMPRATNDTEAGRYKNRRVEMIIK